MMLNIQLLWSQVCGKSITDFEMRRLSISGNQNITGTLKIDTADAVNAVVTEKLNNKEVNSVIHRTNSSILELSGKFYLLCVILCLY